MPREGSRPGGAFIVEPLTDHILDVLFRQSIIGSQRGDPYLDGVRRLARLIEAEVQGQAYEVAGERMADWKRRQPLRSKKEIDQHRAASSKGAQALHAKRTAGERSEAARKAARARWSKQTQDVADSPRA